MRCNSAVGAAPNTVLDRAWAVLSAFDPDDTTLSLSDLRARTGIARATVHRLAVQLTELGLLERAPAGYRLGIRLFQLGEQVPRVRELRRVAYPFLQDLHAATHAIVHLGVLEGNRVLYIEKITATGNFPVPSRAGSSMPAHATALGKALLAFAPDAVVSAVIAGGLAPLTPFTIAVPAVLAEQLAEIRGRGWAVEREESVLGNACVGAPVFGPGRRVLAAVSVSGPVNRIDPIHLGPAIRRTAVLISGALARRPTAALAGPERRLAPT